MDREGVFTPVRKRINTPRAHDPKRRARSASFSTLPHPPHAQPPARPAGAPPRSPVAILPAVAAARFVVVGVVPPPSAPRPSVVRPPTADRRRPSPPPRPVRPFNNVRRRSRPSAADARSFADPPVAPVRPHDDDDDEFVYDRAYRCAGRSFVGAFHTVENKTKNAHENFEQNEKVSLF